VKKSRFPLLLTLGVLPFILILPLLNYLSDPWRVLHKDYGHAYENISINKRYLKISYLSEHPDHYDILLFGSSRNASLVETDIAPKAYNAYYDFGVVSNHLQSIRYLLRHGLRPKEIWIGINDFDIWKDPKDFDTDYSKCGVPDSMKTWISTMRLFLYKPLNYNDIAIFQGKIPFLPSNRVYRKNLQKHRAILIEKEKNAVKKGKAWRLKLAASAGTLLGYKDAKEAYRIDAAINEIESIKKLCEKEDIQLRLFFYPTFYKTYVLYNQKRIAEFKRKLAAVHPFYDFYRLDDTAFDALKWHDTSHFFYSVGLKIVQTIKHRETPVTKQNVQAHLMAVQNDHSRLMSLQFPSPTVLRLNPSITIPGIKRIWHFDADLISQINQIRFEKRNDQTDIIATGNDPFLILPPIPTFSRHNLLLQCRLHSPVKTLFQIFFKNRPNEPYAERRSVLYTLHRGDNRFNLILPARFLHNGLRIDIAAHSGRYSNFQCSLYADAPGIP